MATFKAGQRVKLINKDGFVGFAPPAPPIGAEGVVVQGAILDDKPAVKVRFDGRDRLVSCFHYELAPLTDPGADAFMERIKSLKPYEEPKREAAERLVERVMDRIERER